MSYIGSKTQQVRSSSSHLQEVIPLPSALPGPALGPPSYPSFSTANLLFSWLLRYDPSKTQPRRLRPSFQLCSVRPGWGQVGAVKLQALKETRKGIDCEARNDLILTIFFFWSLSSLIPVMLCFLGLHSALQLPCLWILLWLPGLRPGSFNLFTS